MCAHAFVNYCYRCDREFSAPTALIFNQQSRPEVLDLLKALHDNLRASLGEQTSFDHVVFCTNVTWKGKGYGNGKPLA